MGQAEVLQWLKEQKKKNNDWFDVNQIKEGLRQQGFNETTLNKTHGWLYKLSAFGLIKFRGEGLWKHKKYFQYRK